MVWAHTHTHKHTHTHTHTHNFLHATCWHHIGNNEGETLIWLKIQQAGKWWSVVIAIHEVQYRFLHGVHLRMCKLLRPMGVNARQGEKNWISSTLGLISEQDYSTKYAMLIVESASAEILQLLSRFSFCSSHNTIQRGKTAVVLWWWGEGIQRDVATSVLCPQIQSIIFGDRFTSTGIETCRAIS